MNSIQAQNLYALLTKAITLNPSLPPSSLKSHLGAMYVPSPFQNNTVYPRESWQGRLCSWIQYPWKKNSLKQKTLRIFAGAIEALSTTSHPNLQDAQQMQVAKLYHEILKDGNQPHLPLHSHGPALNPAAEIKEMQDLASENRKAHLQNIECLSLLHTNDNRDSIDLKTFKTLFRADTDLEIQKALEYIKTYLMKHPRYAVDNFDQKLDIIQQALQENQKLITQFLPNGKPIHEDDRLLLMQQMSSKMAKDVHELNEHQKKMFVFSYGNSRPSLQSLFVKLRLLPPDIIKEFPPLIVEYLKQGKTPNENEIANDLIKSCLSMISTWADETDLGGVNVTDKGCSLLFPDSSRSLPSEVSSFLPDVFEAHLEQLLQGGVLGNAPLLFSNPQVKSALAWIAQNGEELLKNNPQQKVTEKVENCLIQFVQKKLNAHLDSLTTLLSNQLKEIQEAIPDHIIEMAGFDWLLFSGPIWIEFEKLANHSYSANIYSLGNSLNNHSINPRTGDPYFVLRLNQIHKDKIDSTFFYSLLSKHLEPYWNPDSTPKAYDIYSGPVTLLEGIQSSNKSDDPSVESKFPVSDLRMIQMSLFKSGSNNIQPVFEMQLEAVLNLCKPHLKRPQNVLVIRNPEVRNALKEAIPILKQSCITLKGNQENKEKIAQVEATLLEIQNAINSFHSETSQSIPLPEDMQKSFQEFLSSCGITTENMAHLKDFISWSLGDDAGQFFEEIFNYYKPFIPAETLTKKKSASFAFPSFYGKTQEWLFTSYSSIYFHIAKKALTLVLGISGFYSGGLRLTLSFPLIISILPYILPPAVLDWYHHIMNVIQLKLAQLVIRTLWKYALNEDTRQTINVLWKEWNQKIKETKGYIQQNPILSFKLETPVPIPESCEGSANLEVQPVFKPLEQFEQVCHDPDHTEQPNICPHAIHPIEKINSPKILEDTLNAWLSEAQKNYQIYKNAKTFDDFNVEELVRNKQTISLVQRILSLEVPSRFTQTIWDQLTDPEKYLDLLSDLGILMYQMKNQIYEYHFHTQENYRRSVYFDKRNLNLKFLAAMYQIQAILYSLGRRCSKSSLEKQSINATPLVALYQSIGFKIDDPTVLDKIQSICSYLMPDLDLNSHISPDDLSEHANFHLFHYCHPHKFGFEFLTNEDILANFLEGNLTFLSYAEYVYLNDVLQDPETDKKIKALGFSETLCSRKKMCILFQESFVFNRSDPLVPRPFSLLKLHTLLCQNINPDWLLSPANFTNPKLMQPPLYPPNCTMSREVCFSKISYYVDDFSVLNYSCPLFSSLESGFSPCLKWPQQNEMLILDPKACEDEPHVTHCSNNQQHTNVTTLFQNAYPEIEILEIAGKTPSERIIRLMNYLQKHKESLNLSSNSSSSLHLLVEAILFAPGALKEQIQHSSQFPQAIGKCFAELLQHFEKTNQLKNIIWLADLGLRTKRYCEYYEKKTSDFPDFNSLLRRFLNSKDESLDPFFHTLYARSFGFPKKGSLCHPIEPVIAFLNAWILLPHESAIPTKLGMNIYAFFIEEFSRWLPTIEQILNIPLHRDSILNALAKKLDWTLKDPDSKYWKKMPYNWLCFYNANICFDFEKPSFSTNYFHEADPFSNVSTKFLLKKTKQNHLVKRLVGNSISKPWKEVAPCQFQSEDNRFLIYFSNVSKGEIIILQNWKKAWYKPVEFTYSSEYFNPSLLKKLKVKSVENLNFWSNGSGPIKKLLIQNKDDHGTFLILRYNPSQPENFLRPGLKGSSSLSSLTAHAVPQNQYIDGLKPLIRFSPANKISAKASPGQNSLSEIVLENRKLHFDIKKNSGSQEIASSREFLNFHIAPLQSHPVLQHISSYLVLESPGGRKKVLIDKKQWLTGIASRLTFLAGPFERYCLDLFAQQEGFISDEYFTFEIVEEGSGKSSLMSSDPAALGFLLILYICQGEKNEANLICQKLEWLYNSQKVPITAWDSISLLAFIPIEFEGIGPIRRRLFSAFELNRLRFMDNPKPPKKEPEIKKKENELKLKDRIDSNIKSKDNLDCPPKKSAYDHLFSLFDFFQEDANSNKSKTPSDPGNDLKKGSEPNQSSPLLAKLPENCPSFLRNIAVAGSILIDLRQHLSNPQYPFSTTQELFLFKCAFHQLEIILRDQTGSSDDVLEFFDAVGWDTVIEATCFSPGLSKRYRTLKKKAGINDSLISTLFNGLICLLTTSSGINQLLPGNTKYGHLPWNQKGGFLGTLSQVFSRFRDKKYINVQALNLSELHNCMKPYLEGYPPIEPERLKPEEFKEYFATYYSLAREDFPYLDQDFMRPHHPTKQQLIRLLKFHKGGWDKQTEVLVFILQAVLAYPSSFPPTAELLSAHKTASNSASDQKKNAWHELFVSLNDKAFLSYLAMEYIEPLYRCLLSSSLLLSAHVHFSEAIPEELLSIPYLAPLIKIATTTTKDISSVLFADKTAKLLYPITPNIGMEIIALIEKRDISYIISFILKIFLTWLVLVILEKTTLKTISRAAKITSIANSALIPITGAASQSHLFTLAGAGTAKYFACKKLQMPLEWHQLLPCPALTVPLLHLAGKSYHLLSKSKQANIIKTQEKKQHNSADFSALNCDENLFNTFFKKLFSLAFVENTSQSIPTEKIVQKIQLKNGVNAIVKDRIQRVNDSIEAFYKKTTGILSSYELTKPGALADIYIHLQTFYFSLSSHLKEEKALLLSTLNLSKRGKTQNEITLPQVQNYIEKSTFGSLGKEICLSDAELPKIELAIGRLHLKTSRLQQIERLLEFFNLLFKLSPESNWEKYYETVEAIAIELSNKTGFSLDKNPSKLTRYNLQFEAGSGNLLWEHQTNNRKKVLYDYPGNVVTEEPPGSGKTHYALPLTIAHELNGHQLVLSIAPRQLAGDNQPKINSQLNTIFNKRSYAQSFHRDIWLNKKNLESLVILFTQSREVGEAIQITKEDIQTLRALLDDRLYNYFYKIECKNSSEKECLILLHKILNEFYSHGLAIIDESHEAYRHRHQLSFTVGLPQRINKDFYVVMEATARILMRDRDLKKAIKENKLYKVDRSSYNTTIKPRLAKAMSQYWRFNITDPARQKEFIAFVCDQAEEIPSWIANSPLLYQQISLVKGILGILFPMNFKNMANVDFMASKKGNGEFARPSDGNSHVIEQDSLQNPYETMVKTMLMLFTKGLSKEQFRQLLTILHERASKEIKDNKLLFKDSKVFKKYGKSLPQQFMQKNWSDHDFKVSYRKLRRDPDASLLYIRYHIWKQILYWKKSIQITAQDFSMLFHRQISSTGTPFNDGTYPAWIKMLRDPTTIGELLHIIYQKCPENGIHVLKSNVPKKILAEILSNYFAAGTQFSAIIDGGAQFTGLSNEKVARIIMKHCDKNREDIKAVKFYKEDETGKEKVFCFVKGNPLPVPEASAPFDPKICITYYDQCHGFGADIKQLGDGLVTIGPNHPLYRWLQELFRIRGLKKQQRLKKVKEIDLNFPTQRIHLCMTPDIQRLIMGMAFDAVNVPTPTLPEIVEYAVHNEAAIAEEEHFPSACRKVLMAVKKAIYEKIILTPSEKFKVWSGIWKQFEGLFVNEIEDDPAKLFGLVKDNPDSKKALLEAANEAYEIVSSSSLFTKEEKEKLKDEISNLPLPVLNDTVTIWRKGKNGAIKLSALDSLETSQTVQTSNEANEAANETNETENQNEHQLQNQQLLPQDKFNMSLFQERDWPEIKDPSSIDWLKISSPKCKSRFFLSESSLMGLRKKTTCRFYLAQDLIADAKAEVISKAAEYFDDRLWIPNNFVARKVAWGGFSREYPFDIGSKGQFRLNTVLIHFVEKDQGLHEVLSMGPLSTRDTGLWRKKLSRNPSYNWADKKVKTVLWDVHSQSILAGCPIDQNGLRRNEDLLLLVGQLKLLDGDPEISKEKKAMSHWLAQENINAEIVRSAFEAIHWQRGRLPYPSSPADKLFSKMTPNHPFEEEI